MMRNCKLIRYNKSKQVICFTSTSIWIYTIYTASKLSTMLLYEHNILIHHRSVQHQLWLKNYFHRLQWYQISHSTHLSYISEVYNCPTNSYILIIKFLKWPLQFSKCCYFLKLRNAICPVLESKGKVPEFRK